MDPPLNLEPLIAYIGPGPGLGAIGAMLTLLGALVLVVVGLVWYPLKRLLGRAGRPGRKDARGEAERITEVESPK